MNFWIFAIALLALPAVIVSWPLFPGSAKDRITALFLVLMIPLAGILLYQEIGTPEAINLPTASPSQASAQQQQPHSSQGGQMEDLVATLQQRMNENPDDPEGWLILGRSLKTMQRYAEAETALSNANRLKPGNPLIMVELAETILFASGQPQISPQARKLIEAALAIDPQMQKALWLMGMASSQDGDETQAIAYWEKLLEQIDPTSGSATAVKQQIEMAQARMGESPADTAASDPTTSGAAIAEKVAVKTPSAVADSGIPVNLTIDDELRTTMPGNAILFVFIHPAGTKGMPLAVKRLAAQGFPLSLNFSDADLLRPETSLQDFEQLDISARVSMRGGVVPTTGDIQSNLETLNTKAVTTIALHLDQRVP
jgi:cytochrome c-type biogenesis protein CcmH